MQVYLLRVVCFLLYRATALKRDATQWNRACTRRNALLIPVMSPDAAGLSGTIRRYGYQIVQGFYYLFYDGRTHNKKRYYTTKSLVFIILHTQWMISSSFRLFSFEGKVHYHFGIRSMFFVKSL